MRAMRAVLLGALLALGLGSTALAADYYGSPAPQVQVVVTPPPKPVTFPVTPVAPRAPAETPVIPYVLLGAALLGAGVILGSRQRSRHSFAARSPEPR